MASTAVVAEYATRSKISVKFAIQNAGSNPDRISRTRCVKLNFPPNRYITRSTSRSAGRDCSGTTADPLSIFAPHDMLRLAVWSEAIYANDAHRDNESLAQDAPRARRPARISPHSHSRPDRRACARRRRLYLWHRPPYLWLGPLVRL